VKKEHEPFQFTFNGFLKVAFQGSRVTSDAGLILVRELDERLGLEKLLSEHLSDSRQGLNTQFRLADLLRQSVYSRLAGYEDLNDAARLSADPTFRLIGSARIWDRGAALTSTLHWFETELLTREENLVGLMAVNRDVIGQAETFDRSDRIVLDMDSSESPVHGHQEGSAYNGHFESVCYHPLFLFNNHGDCLAAKLRPGNVHSADEWDELLVPEIERQRAEGKRVAFRADAAFAKPDIYDALEKRGVEYAIRMPANENLEWATAELLFRPPGRPSQKPLVRYKSFSYQAGSWTKVRRIVAKVEHHAGELFACRIHRHESPPAQSRGRAVLQQARHRRAMDQGRQAGGALDAAVLSPVSRERGPAAIERAGLQLGQPVAAAGVAQAHRQLVADQRAATPRQNRRAFGQTCAVLLAAAGRESSDSTLVRGDAPGDLGAASPDGLTRDDDHTGHGWRRKGTSVESCPRNASEPWCSRRFSLDADRADGLGSLKNARTKK